MILPKSEPVIPWALLMGKHYPEMYNFPDFDIKLHFLYFLIFFIT